MTNNKNPLEVKVEKAYCDWLQNDYLYMAIALKLVLFVGGGFPDRTILSQGRVFFIEFKRQGRNKKLDALQKVWRKRLRRLGFKVYVCDTIEEAQAATLKNLAGA